MASAQHLTFPLSEESLKEVNAHLTTLTPENILGWSVDHLLGLYQTTAFGLTGLVGIDMLSKITSTPPPLIFLDTLYHFPETYELVNKVKERYNVPIHVYKPEGCNDVKEFEAKHGERLWETDEDAYDYLVKVCAIFAVDRASDPRVSAGRAGAKGVQGIGCESGDHRTAGIAGR